MTRPGLLDPSEAFARLGRIKLSETDLDGVLRTIAGLARQTIPGADQVSVTLIRDRAAQTAAHTGEVALLLDQHQYEAGRGPCLDAAAAHAILSVPRIRGDDRWPEWAAAASRQGINSSLAIGLPVQEKVTGALNIYATTPEAFDDEAVGLAQTFAGYAAAPLTNAHLFHTTATLAEQMRAAMQSRAVIEQAKGIVMRDRRCTADEAFTILTGLSQDTNRKLRDIAQLLVDRASQPPPR